MRATPLLCVLAVAALLAGCTDQSLGLLGLGKAPDAPLTDLAATHAKKALDNVDGTRSFLWDGVTTGGASAVLVTKDLAQQPALNESFDVDNRVGFVEANVTYKDDVGGSLVALIKDNQGRVQCGAVSFLNPSTCTVPVPVNATSKVPWRVIVTSGYEGNEVGPPNVPFKVSITLHRPREMTRGDPLAGVDPAISFKVSDTGVRGSEDNIGVLGDGQIFTQKGLHTMRSKDDGATWVDVAPATTNKQTLDPMLYVDPWRSTVYIDQLYVGCSILAWSKDAGSSWTTNPAACGLPGDDHEKIGAGPSNVPGSPFPIVYYSFSSFGGGVYVSRSLDGGVTWIPSQPIVGVNDGRAYDNTGHVFADEKGNVYDPLYMCDHGGYMGVGVSNDYGASYRFVEVDKKPGACTDPDPGLSVDTNGTAYLAYHRDDGVYYSFSTDKGATWSAPVLVSPPTQKSFVHVDSIAGDTGRLAIVWRGTSDSAKGPDTADGWSAWHLYVAFVANATSAKPDIKVGHVGALDDIQQRGSICTGGVSCSGGSRNLVDFIDIAVGPDGRVYTTYQDGCKDPCETPADSRAGLGLVGIQVAGPRLFETKAPWASGGATNGTLPDLAIPKLG